LIYFFVAEHHGRLFEIFARHNVTYNAILGYLKYVFVAVTDNS